MKKARITLLAIAVLAVVSGAIAFKAKSVKFELSIYSCNTIDKLCDIIVTENVTFTAAGTLGALTYSSVAINPNITCPANTCPSTFTVIIDN